MIRFTVSICAWLGSLVNRLTIKFANKMSGRVSIMVNIVDPTMPWKFLISESVAVFLVRDKESSLISALAGLTDCNPKICAVFSIYPD